MTNNLGSVRGRFSRWAPALAGVILLLSLAVAGWAYWRDQSHAASLQRDHEVILASERLLSSVKDVESGERGFIITRQDDYMQPYRNGIAAVPTDRDRLSSLLGPSTQHLNELIEARMTEAARGIAAARAQGATAGSGSILTGVGKGLMDQIRAEIAAIQATANRNVDAVLRARRSDDLLRLMSTAGFLVACVAVGALAWLRRRESLANMRLFEDVLENAPVGLGILDHSFRIRHINQALSKMSERALSAQPGMSIWDVIPDMRDTLEARLRRVAEGGRAASTEVEASSNVRRDEVRSFQANFYPLRSAGGARKAHGVGMVIADITSRKRAERLTRESEERFRSLVEASASIIWTTDAEGAFVKPQPSWMAFTGQSAEACLGWGRIGCLHPDDIEKTRAAWDDAKAQGIAFRLENRLRRHDGTWRHMDVSIVPVREDDGTIREWVGSHSDITGRKEAELALEAAKEAAESANRAKSSFLANMSHELRTPLSAVIGYSEMLEEEAEEKGEADMLSDLGKIKSNAKHLLSLINDVLDLSKVEANKMDTYAEDIEVAGFVTDAAETVEALVQRRGNRLKVELAEGLGTMHSDAVKLRQCLFNLLSNAAKFTADGTITLGASRETGSGGDWLSFTVRDTGIGMSPEQLARLFQRFVQADETTTRKFGGTGLGLALSRAFARLLGGDITVESQEGVGTCFTLRVPTVLPVRIADGETASRAETPPEPRGAGELVLVIDDEASQRDLMTRFLQRQGFSVQTAPDGRSGLELARASRPHVILLDVMMPGLDGWSVLSTLKADPETQGIPVVMVSFVADAGLSSALGAAGSMPKPVDWDRLRTVLDRFRDERCDILVVDDDADTRSRLRAMLEKNGWSVQEAADGQQALERVGAARPHVILLDLTMPVMDGFAFLHRLRDVPGCADVPVIVLSARDISPDDRERLADADRVLRKGETSMRDLVAEVRHLEGRMAEDNPG